MVGLVRPTFTETCPTPQKFLAGEIQSKYKTKMCLAEMCRPPPPVNLGHVIFTRTTSALRQPVRAEEAGGKAGQIPAVGKQLDQRHQLDGDE